VRKVSLFVLALACAAPSTTWSQTSKNNIGSKNAASPAAHSKAVQNTAVQNAAGGNGASGQSAIPTAKSLEKIAQVVAVVGGQTISRDKLAQACIDRFGAIVLDNLLNKQLIIQACQAKGIVITKADVNNEIERTASGFGLSTKLFLQSLQEERDISPEHYASEIVWPMLALRRLAADKIAVSNEEIDKAIQSEFGPKVSVRMILVSSQPKAQELHKQLTAQPELFRRLAKEHSEDASSASAEGLLPPIRRFSGDDILENMAFQLKEEELSPVFQLGNMHAILHCVRHYPSAVPAPQYLPAIQEEIRDRLRDQRLGKAADELFTALHQNSKAVSVIGNPDLEKQHPGIAGFINNQPIPRDLLAWECISRHGRTVLRGEINRALLTEALRVAKLTVTEQDIAGEIARIADRMGHIKADGSPDSEAWLKTLMEEEKVTYRLYVEDSVWPSTALRKLVVDEVQVTPEDLQKGFESNFGPRAEVLAVVLTNQRDAENVFRQARQNLSEKSFGELAAKYSVEATSRSNFGKIQPIRRHSGMPTLERAAFELKAGELSPVVAMNDQFCILYKQGETEPIVTDFNVVKDEIQREIREKKINVAMKRKMDSLLKNSNIENFLENSISIGKSEVVPASGTSSSGNVAPAAGRSAPTSGR
jgi:parvulin-like peptidyl-prolyl isomerase